MPNVQTSNGAVGSGVNAEQAEQPAELPTAFQSWLEEGRQRIDHALSMHLKEQESVIGPHSRLAEAVQYSVNVGGKRLRPLLVLECCRVCGGRPEQAMPAALAMELIHTFSLIHDDLPAMDNDDLRRGKPTNHKVFGDGMAVLAGDWLLAHAFTLLLSDRIDPRIMARLVQALGRGTEQMIEGQGADIEGEGRTADKDLVTYIHERKTAALIETSCRLGATCAGASEDVVEALVRYGHHLGLAFQIADDLLDATGSTEKMGKRVGKDATVDKQTYPAAFGIEASRAQARREAKAALQALEPFGPRAERLRDLAHFVIRREN